VNLSTINRIISFPLDFDNPSINNLVKSGDARIRASHKAILSSLKALWVVMSKLKLFFF
jgi:hypothetical protein